MWNIPFTWVDQTDHVRTLMFFGDRYFTEVSLRTQLQFDLEDGSIHYFAEIVDGEGTIDYGTNGETVLLIKADAVG